MVLFFYIITIFIILFPSISSRYMPGDCEFYVYTCKCLIYIKKRCTKNLAKKPLNK